MGRAAEHLQPGCRVVIYPMLPTNELSEKLEALHAHRAKLERSAEEARRRGDRASFETTQLLLRQCDFLILQAQEKQTTEASS